MGYALTAGIALVVAGLAGLSWIARSRSSPEQDRGCVCSGRLRMSDPRVSSLRRIATGRPPTIQAA